MATNPVQLDFSKAVSVPQAQPMAPDPNTGVTLDFSKAQPVPGASPAPYSDELRINSDDNLLAKGAKVVGGTLEGIGEGVFGTAAGASDILDKTTGMTPGTVNRYLHKLAGDENSEHGTAQIVGRGLEDIGEFILGDEALKGLAISQRLLKASNAAKIIEESPVLNRIFNAGVRAIRGGTVSGTQGYIKSSGDVGDAVITGTLGAFGNAAIPEAIDLAKAAGKALPGALDTVKNVLKPGAIQTVFQNEIRTVINDAAREFGVDGSKAASIRDVAAQVSDSLQTKAKTAYQALDDATGGRVQRFKDAIRNVQQKIRELNGIDPDQEGAYIERLNDLTDAHERVMQEAESQGVPRSLLDEANAFFKKSKAMLDLSKHIRASSEGLRPELVPGAKSPIPETLNPAKLFPRVQKLFDAGRLQDALGHSRAADLLRAVNDSHAATQLAESWRAMAKKYGKYAAVGIPGYELIRHLLGD